jgi:LacI family transcriptional regulator
MVERTAVDSVVVDNVAGARAGVLHLYDAGFRRIACITGPDWTTTGRERLEGYAAALAGCGVEYDPSLVVTSDYKQEGGASAMRQLLAARKPPDAVLVANSVMGMGALNVAHDAGVAIPDELGLVCFDDAPWMSLTAPTVTAVAQPTYAIGCEAARLLIGRIDGDRSPARRVIMGTELHARQSSRAGAATPAHKKR